LIVKFLSKQMHVDEFIFNCCVSSMISSENISDSSEECAMNVFSIDENKIRDANGIIFAEAITCYKCTFCGKMFAAMEVVLTHYQSNHRCSVIPLLKGNFSFCFAPFYWNQNCLAGMKLSSSKIKNQKLISPFDHNCSTYKQHRRGRPSKDMLKERTQQALPPNLVHSQTLKESPQPKPLQTKPPQPKPPLQYQQQLQKHQSIPKSRADFLKKLRPASVKVMYTESKKKKFRCRISGLYLN
jgi:hypothetical protein